MGLVQTRCMCPLRIIEAGVSLVVFLLLFLMIVASVLMCRKIIFKNIREQKRSINNVPKKERKKQQHSFYSVKMVQVRMDCGPLLDVKKKQREKSVQ